MIANTRAGVTLDMEATKAAILATEVTKAVILAMAETKEAIRDTRLFDEQNAYIATASGESDGSCR